MKGAWSRCFSRPGRRRRELLEHRTDVSADGRVAGEEAQIGVETGIACVIVARTQVGVVAKVSIFPTHDEAQFGMSFVPDHAVHHVRPGFFQVMSQLDIRFLIEPGAQFDDHVTSFPPRAASTSDCTMAESAPVR